VKVVNHNKFIIEFQDFVDHSLCDEIVRKVESNEGYVNNPCQKSFVKHNKFINLSRDSRFREVDELSYGIISSAHGHYQQRCTFSHFLGNYFKDLTCDFFYRYYDSGDYYNWHIDKDQHAELVFSYLVYLNDDFEGGDTLFLADKLKVKPKKGSVLCFPCDFTYIHKSTKVRSGLKKVIWTCLGRPH
tara:strand:+ start:90 stop:650 length:561 start_codon:yes stop_codon:yes gene_type:complete